MTSVDGFGASSDLLAELGAATRGGLLDNEAPSVFVANRLVEGAMPYSS